ncbi:glycosyltransferase family 9 protein [Sphingobium amiense]|nr:glycosyltransferase family 9 protein [Sphingobium amiense]
MNRVHHQGSAASSARNSARVRELRELVSAIVQTRGSELVIDAAPNHVEGEVHDLVIADRLLQTIDNYRQAIQQWFASTTLDGHLIVTVPHAFLYDRQIMLPSPWDRRNRRLYTPAALVKEIEEALPPNSYRLRLVSDDDRGYDYGRSDARPPMGSSDIVAVLQKIEAPLWSVTPEGEAGNASSRDDFFFLPRTRVEAPQARRCANILLLKLDHLGDFIMGLPAIERVRALFPHSHITLVVGSWNEEMAVNSGLVDRVVAFDVFPRNASEEVIDVHGKKALFEDSVAESYDLAIDLRTDPDTRFLLSDLQANVKAGLGMQSDFPFLDIFLPVDFNRHGPETSLEDRLSHGDFGSASVCLRNDFRLGYDGSGRPKRGALIWGPYRDLPQGSYIFEPLMEVGRGRSSASFLIDITLDGQAVRQEIITGPTVPNLAFDVGARGARFEARIWANRWKRTLPFSFYGGRLYRKGSANILHQTEYLLLLIELIAIRLQRTGLLREVMA